jgi:hypothetical protein
MPLLTKRRCGGANDAGKNDEQASDEIRRSLAHIAQCSTPARASLSSADRRREQCPSDLAARLRKCRVASKALAQRYLPSAGERRKDGGFGRAERRLARMTCYRGGER